MSRRKRCPNGFRKNKKTGECEELDEVDFYFNTKRSYSRKFIGGLEFETCVLKEKENLNVSPYERTEDMSLECKTSSQSPWEYVTPKPFPIVDIMNTNTKVGEATQKILKDLSNACQTYDDENSACGTHVHMSGPYTKQEYRYFNVVMRYLWVQYFQPYFVVRFYRHQNRFNNGYTQLSTAKPIGKYEMFNEQPSKNNSQKEWHFEFRGFGEMIGKFDTEGHEYLKMLMNLFEASAKLHRKLKLNDSWDNPRIKQYTGYGRGTEKGQYTEKIWKKLLKVRVMMQNVAPTYIGSNYKKRRYKVEMTRDPSDAIQLVWTFDSDVNQHGKDIGIGPWLQRYKLIHDTVQIIPHTSVMPPMKRHTGNTYSWRITWHKDLDTIMAKHGKTVVENSFDYRYTELRDFTVSSKKDSITAFYTRKDKELIKDFQDEFIWQADCPMQQIELKVFRNDEVVRTFLACKLGNAIALRPKFSTVYEKQDIFIHVNYEIKYQHINKLNEELPCQSANLESRLSQLKLKF